MSSGKNQFGDALYPIYSESSHRDASIWYGWYRWVDGAACGDVKFLDAPLGVGEGRGGENILAIELNVSAIV